MKMTAFNDSWTVRSLADNTVKEVTLPHDAMISEKRSDESIGGANIGFYMGGDYEYTKVFSVPAEWKDQEAMLEFDGVYQKAEVYVNGEKAAYRPYGYINFMVDLKPFLKYGEENEIKVIAHNSEQPNSRWYSGTGIYRPVHLYTSPEKHILPYGLKVKTLDAQSGRIEVTVKTSHEGTVILNIADDHKVNISTENCIARTEMTIDHPQLWSAENPYLYTITAEFEGDSSTETFGIRTVGWDSDHGFTVNGERVILKGACIHHDNGVLGAATYYESEERRIRRLKEAGYNAVRSSHYPCSKELLEACDRLGMYMMDEYVDCWYIHKTKYDYVNDLAEWWRKDFTDWVNKDYNHPCVIMYSTGNEVAETSEKKGIALTKEFTEELHRLDGTRPVTCGINIFFNFLYSMGMGVYSDDKADAEVKKAEAKAKKPVGSEFYNTLAVAVGDKFMKFGATLYPCDLKTRDAFANMDIAGYNYGLWRYKHDLKKYPKRLILGSETFCKDAYAFYEIAKDNPRIIGDFVWAGMDYLGETGDGYAEYSDYNYGLKDGWTRMTGGNGRVDLIGNLRAEAYFTRVAFEEDQGPYLAVKPVYEDENPAITGWALTKALRSWDYPGCNGKKAVVEVYARAYSAELFVNGKSAGKKKIGNSCRIIFHTKYEDGTLSVVTYDKDGNKIGEDALKTGGSETILKLNTEVQKAEAGRPVYVDISYEDENGIVRVKEKHDVKVTVENGELMGLGSANAYKYGNYTDDTTDTYFGRALAVVRGSGTMRVKAEDETGRSTEIVIETEA